MGTPEKPTTRRLKAAQDLQASDSKATGLQSIDLEAPAKNKRASAKNISKPYNPSMEADGKMYHCSGCQQKFNKASIAKFCPLKNIRRKGTYAQRFSDMEEQMSSVLHSRDQLEVINAQLQQQNRLLQEQVSLLRKQVNQAQAPGTPSGVVPGGHNSSPLLHEWNRGLEALCLGGTWDPIMAHTAYQGNT